MQSYWHAHLMIICDYGKALMLINDSLGAKVLISLASGVFGFERTAVLYAAVSYLLQFSAWEDRKSDSWASFDTSSSSTSAAAIDAFQFWN